MDRAVMQITQSFLSVPISRLLTNVLLIDPQISVSLLHKLGERKGIKQHK
jgi:hypothetical protein